MASKSEAHKGQTQGAVEGHEGGGKKKKGLLLFAGAGVLMLALVAMLGCSEDNPAKPQTVEEAVKGSYETTFQFIPMVCVDAGRAPVDCSVAGAIPVVVSTPFNGVGGLSDLNKGTVSSKQTVDFTKTPPTLTGTNEFTAANGDKLIATHSGVSGVPDATGSVTFSGDYVFTGGTGKFDGITGGGKYKPAAQLEGGRSLSVWDGSWEMK